MHGACAKDIDGDNVLHHPVARVVKLRSGKV